MKPQYYVSVQLSYFIVTKLIHHGNREQKEPAYLTTVNASLPVALQQVSHSQSVVNTVSNLYILL